MPRVTLRAIAERVGCTRSTVSYALREHPGISEPVRVRIQQVARELGWRPDAELRRYMSMVRSTSRRMGHGNLAVLHNRESRHLAWKEGTLAGHLRGILRRAEELGFNASVFSLRETPMSASRFEGVLRARGVNGLVYMDCDIQLPRDFWGLSRRFAAVSVGVDPRHTRVSVALSDYLSLGQRAINELRQLGFKRIAVVLAKALEIMVNWGFTAGVCAGMAQLPAVSRIPIFYAGKSKFYVEEREFENVRRYLRDQRADVVLAVDTIGCDKIVRGAADLASLPVYSLDFVPDSGAVGGVDQRPEAVGIAGVDLVVAQINNAGISDRLTLEKVSVKEGWVPAS